ncbi:TonB family protein [Mucilaginibacter arboris]|uniref:TonB family protein n=1 Tax=Mucilaginibacter arboris TaxID=2682090 RepID=A0A7K1SSH5_9SPHI|nr:TonB family protein [Mucilaginibacter arboris]MVN20197.1 TonB family protein [Mucilaginibacter arboris]
MLYLFIFFQTLLTAFTSQDQPQFKGGQNALNSFLSQNLIYPDFSKQNCISGTVQISFNINQNNKPVNVKVQKGFGIDLDDEAVRLVKLTAGKWVLPPNHDSNTTLILPVHFNLNQYNCGNRTQADMEQAIAAYKAREALVDAVTNYYENKYAGQADTSKEPEILALKKQLGLDDDYADEVVNQANQKLKQGDREGACKDWKFVRNIGSNKADAYLARYCK